VHGKHLLLMHLYAACISLGSMRTAGASVRPPMQRRCTQCRSIGSAHAVNQLSSAQLSSAQLSSAQLSSAQLSSAIGIEMFMPFLTP
jgi:uncharacterized protein YjbI with pentapeptide repeats